MVPQQPISDKLACYSMDLVIFDISDVGLNLGMVYIKEIMKLCGGRIWVNEFKVLPGLEFENF